jgi:hypothetical protein
MGLFVSRPFIQIEDKRLSYKQFRELKTYKDVLQVAGYKVFDTTTLRKIDKRSEYFTANESFKFGGTLYHEDKAIYIQRLY